MRSAAADGEHRSAALRRRRSLGISRYRWPSPGRDDSARRASGRDQRRCRDHAIGERRQLRPQRANRGGRRRRRPAVRRFSPSLKLLDFPIGQRSSWRQAIDTFRNDIQLKGQIRVYGQVQGRAPVTVPAGSYDAVAIYRIVQLDDEEFWRSRTTRRDQVRYAPEVKGVVREVHDAEYFELTGGPDSATIRTEYTTTELLS